MREQGLATRQGQVRVEVVRVYEDPGRHPGEYRVLVDRLWPRGIKKEEADLDEWAKDVAPSRICVAGMGTTRIGSRNSPVGMRPSSRRTLVRQRLGVCERAPRAGYTLCS